MKYVYLIQSLENPTRRYVGVTDDIERRFAEHNGGKSPHTAKYRPWVLKVVMVASGGISMASGSTLRGIRVNP